MKFSSWILIVSALFQGITAPVLVYLGFGAFGAVLAYTLSSVLTGLISALTLYFSIYRKLPQVNITIYSIIPTLKPLLVYGIPLAICSIISGLAAQFGAFMMASYTSAEAIGNYKIATNFATLLSLLTIPIITVLFPAFSKMNSKTEHDDLCTIFRASVKYGSIILAPAALAVIVLSDSIIGSIYGVKWPLAPFFLFLGTLTSLWVVFGSQSMPTLLSATGETNLLMRIHLLSLGVTVAAGFCLIPYFGVAGVFLTNIIASIPRNILGLFYLWRRFRLTVNFWSSVKILLAAFLPAVSVYFILNSLFISAWAKLFVGAVLFLTMYLFSAPTMGAVNQQDLNTLKTMFSNLGIFSKLLNFLLKIMEKQLRFNLFRNWTNSR